MIQIFVLWSGAAGMHPFGFGEIDYASLWRQNGTAESSALTVFLQEQFPYLCRDAYLALTPRATEIVRFQHGTFEYVFDNYSSSEDEERLVVVCGKSATKKRPRDDYRLKGWIGRT